MAKNTQISFVFIGLKGFIFIIIARVVIDHFITHRYVDLNI